MKYFGQFLVSKGIISEDTLVDALIEQVTQLPSLLQLVRSMNLIPSAVLLTVFDKQSAKQLEFKHACHELGLWSAEIDIAIKKALEEARIPLGQILLKKSVTDLQTLTKALDEFLSHLEVEKAQTGDLPKTPGQSISGSNDHAPQANIALDPVLVEELLAYLTEERLVNLGTLFGHLTNDNIKSNKELQDKALKQLFSEGRSIRGLLRFVRLEKAEALVARLEAVLLKSMEQSASGDLHLLEELSDLGKNVTELLVKLKGYLVQSASDMQWIQSGEWNDQAVAIQEKFSVVIARENITEVN
jgi:hypothetical protein